MGDCRLLRAGCGEAYCPCSATAVEPTARSRIPAMCERMTERPFAVPPWLSVKRLIWRYSGWIGCSASGASPRTVRRCGNGLSGRWRTGEELSETAEALAELIIAEELKLGRWQEVDLKTRPKGDSVKVALAARLRAETAMTVGWIAERLAMGTRDS